MSTASPTGHLTFQDPGFPLREELLRHLDAAAFYFKDVDAVVEYRPDLRYDESMDHVRALLEQTGVAPAVRPETQWAEMYGMETLLRAEAERIARPLTDWVPPIRGDLCKLGRCSYAVQEIDAYVLSIIGPQDNEVEQAVQRQFELHMPAAARLVLGNSSHLRLLIHLADWDVSLGYGSGRLCLDWSNVALPVTPGWGPAWVPVADTKSAPGWWAARLENVFGLTRVAVERAINRAAPASATAAAPPADAPDRSTGKRGGRPSKSDPEKDRKLFDDWKASAQTVKEFARARGLDRAEVEDACKRHRTRQSRERQSRS
jgi:hypothetical protein